MIQLLYTGYHLNNIIIYTTIYLSLLKPLMDLILDIL